MRLLTLVALWLLMPAGAAAQAPTLPENGADLKLLFEATFTPYNAPERAFVEAEAGPRGFSMRRDLIAQGEGRLAGPKLRGTITWSLLNRRFPDLTHTSAHLVGFMELDDGAEAMYRALGFAVVPDPAQPDDGSTRPRCTSKSRMRPTRGSLPRRPS